MNTESKRSEIEALAGAIAGFIVSDPSLAEALSGGLGAGFTCAPKKLCCFYGYNCSAPFTCPSDFRCPQGFATGLSGRARR